MTDKQRAVCGESRTHGSEGGVGKQACDHVGQPLRPAPTLPIASLGLPNITLQDPRMTPLMRPTSASCRAASTPARMR